MAGETDDDALSSSVADGWRRGRLRTSILIYRDGLLMWAAGGTWNHDKDVVSVLCPLFVRARRANPFLVCSACRCGLFVMQIFPEMSTNNCFDSDSREFPPDGGEMPLS
jgi:hypothetical protein